VNGQVGWMVQNLCKEVMKMRNLMESDYYLALHIKVCTSYITSATDGTCTIYLPGTGGEEASIC